jgi:hypothetical protein
MMVALVLLLIAMPLIIAFARALAAEMRRTNWSLLEALIMANILGHVVAYPIYWVLKDDYYRENQRMMYAELAALGGVVAAICMASGAVWVFRRLQLLDERRFFHRMFWMIMGLLLFPSMVLVPFNLVFGWMVWWPLNHLHTRTAGLLPRPVRAKFNRDDARLIHHDQ